VSTTEDVTSGGGRFQLLPFSCWLYNVRKAGRQHREPRLRLFTSRFTSPTCTALLPLPVNVHTTFMSSSQQAAEKFTRKCTRGTAAAASFLPRYVSLCILLKTRISVSIQLQLLIDLSLPLLTALQ